MQVKEKRTLWIGLFAIAVVLVFFMVIDPIQNKATKLESQYLRQTKLLGYMQENVPRLLNSTTTQTQSLEGDVLSIVSKSLDGPIKEFAPNISQTQPNSVQVEITKVPFEVLASWLVNLMNQYPFEIDSLGLRRVGDGLVYVNVSLES